MNEIMSADQVKAGRFELVPEGPNNPDQLQYTIQTSSGVEFGNVSHRQAPLIAADGLAKALNGQWEDGDVDFLAENFGFIWSDYLKRYNNLNVSPESLTTAALDGRISFVIMPAPRNQTFSYN
jgi:hypothetical protein